MKSTVLKVIIIVAFIGIISIIGIVLINNHNVEDKGYKAIISQNNSIDMDLLTQRAGNVSASYNGSPDEYAVYTTKAFLYLNEGISYYLNYFDNISGMSRNTKDELVKLNEAYINQTKIALNKLDIYLSIASKPSSEITSIEKAQIPALTSAFIKEYVNAYSKGSVFFKELRQSITSLVYGNNYYKDFTQISYEITNIYADKSINFVKENMEKRSRGENVDSIYNSVNISNFLKIYDKVKSSQIITPSNEQTNYTYSTFINNYNKINATKFFDDTTTYIAGLNDDLKASANNVKAFLTNSSYYGLVIGG